MKLDPTNRTQLAAVLEYIQLSRHPMHAEAKRLADEFVNANRQEALERQRIAMQQQIDESDDEGLAAFRAQTY